MWQIFTKRAQRVVYYAQEEAKCLGHHEVDTDHLLVGLFMEDENAKLSDTGVWPPAPTVLRANDSFAMLILRKLGVNPEAVKVQALQQAFPGNEVNEKDMVLTAASKRAIDFAYREARLFKNNYIGTEHLLLGLIREEKGVAGRIMAQHGASLEKTRQVIWELQGLEGEVPPQTPPKRPFRLWWGR